ncbi:hypothetical protein SAMN05216404_108140 [Nitrosospira multiformis]|uniref:Core-binding (CB) domain-containing protein n=1 Tax=Nitrosospira multiformis TaxID=1231 RepID=A0A1H8KGM6_9PROT|nr:hypothetical protein [Nitrosospira multiformis]SEN92052.1 hypothetical protein SAMN05216404_108140 [Nitrosospira multiformis]
MARPGKLKGVRDSETFDTKAEVMAWAVETEKAIQAGKRGEIPDKTFGQLLERYRDEVSITKKGERWERLRIGMLCRDEITKIKLQELKTDHFATWRDRGLRSVSAASVLREWTLVSHALNISVVEWRWLRENPIKVCAGPLNRRLGIVGLRVMRTSVCYLPLATITRRCPPPSQHGLVLPGYSPRKQPCVPAR